MNNITNINKHQIKIGNNELNQLYTLEGIITKYISNSNDTILSDVNAVYRFIVKDPDNSLTSKGAKNNDICIKNNNQYYFYTPLEGTTILYIPEQSILHYKNRNWNEVYRFQTGGGGSLIDEPPADSNTYGRKNNAWTKIENINDVPINDKLYVRINKRWELLPISNDVPIDNKLYLRKNRTWVINDLLEAPEDNEVYGRKNKSWFKIPNISNSVTDAPSDGNYYIRRNNSWENVDDILVEESGNNSIPYIRKNRTWVSLINELPIKNDAPTNTKIYGRKDGNWEEITSVGGGEGLPEAPLNSGSYLRNNGTWILTTLDVDAPNDNKSYLRKNKTWVEYLQFNDVENNDILYARKNKSWTPIEIINDAPSDNNSYLRRNKVWIKAKNIPFETDAPQDSKVYGRKDGTWEEITNVGSGNSGSGGLVGDHNTTSNIQGGKVEGKIVTEAYHLTREEYERIPYKPTIISPANNETNINQIPQINGSPYSHPFDYPMYGIEVLISKNSDFTNIIYTYSGFNTSTTFQLPEKQNGVPILETSTEYWVKIRYQDNRRKWSSYSDAVKFETMIEFPTQILATPIMISPTNGGVISDTNPIIILSKPSTNIGIANFISADYQIAGDSEFTNLIYNKVDSSDINIHPTENVNIYGALNSSDVYVRARQKTNEGIYTNWTNVSRCKINPSYDLSIIGLRRIFDKENERIILQHIDENGDVIFLDRIKYLNHHPLFTFENELSETSNDSNPESVTEFVFISPIWMKNNVYEDSNGNMVIDVWFSNYNPSTTGWFLHPAFVLYSNGFYITKLYPKFSDYSTDKAHLKNNYNLNNYFNDFYINYGLRIKHLKLYYTNLLTNIFSVKNYNFINIYQYNLLFYLYMFYSLKSNINYVYSPINEDDRYFYRFFNKILITTEKKRNLHMNGFFYDGLNCSYKLDGPCNVTPFYNYDMNNMDFEFSYDLNINCLDLSSSYQILKIIDIYKGPLSSYQSFDVALLSIPKTLNIGDNYTEKSPFNSLIYMFNEKYSTDKYRYYFRIKKLNVFENIIPFSTMSQNGTLLPCYGAPYNIEKINYSIHLIKYPR